MRFPIENKYPVYVAIPDSFFCPKNVVSTRKHMVIRKSIDSLNVSDLIDNVVYLTDRINCRFVEIKLYHHFRFCRGFLVEGGPRTRYFKYATGREYTSASRGRDSRVAFTVKRCTFCCRSIPEKRRSARPPIEREKSKRYCALPS